MSYPSGSSSRPPQPSRRSREDDDITWLDFLRTAGNTVPADNFSSSSTTERKRRHAGSSPERRGYPYPNPIVTGRRPSGMSAAGPSGSSMESVIDLTTPPRHQQRPDMPQRVSGNGSSDSLRAVRGGIRGNNVPSSMRIRNLERTESSDIVRPKWQPDDEVNRCPVCQTEFHFFYRKHHCRKCGRVVCAACSPHRITIPKQYIVQPPTSSDGEQTPTSPTSAPFGRNLGGGEVVRVCNPCVPDPWTPETAPESLPRQQTEDSSSRRRESADAAPIPDRYRFPILPPPPPSQESGRARSQSHQPPTTHSYSRHPITGVITREPYNRPSPPPPPPSARMSGHRYTQSSSNAPLPPVPPFSTFHPPPPPPAVPRPRRQIREEDECPVCGTELPPGESVREQHIQDCISLRFAIGSPPPPPPRTSSAPDRRNTEPSTSAPTAAAASRPRATSYRPRGMAVYRATEKDCINEDGEAVECVICFEEFQPGDEMGRMECLCKFHRTCIRTWWDTKGVGSCPTHQLHE